MQPKPVIACVSLLAGALIALSGNTALATSTGYEAKNSPALGLPSIDYLGVEVHNTPPLAASALYVAPNGSESAAGTESAPTTLASALARVTPGGTIYLRGGTYRFSQTVTIPPGNDGTSSARTKLSAYPGETPVLNFSAMTEDPANRGLAVNGSFWHVDGIVVEHAGDNGIFIGGSNNIIERTVTRFNHDTGLQLSRISSSTPRDQWPSNNLVLSAESHDNADSDGEDADGFAAKLTVGSGNVFRYAVSHNNIDDGWDLYTKTDTGPIGPVTIEDSLAHDNGTLTDGTQNSNGDRNGYKLGGEDIKVDHVIRRSIAHHNGKHGFTYNRNLGKMSVSDNISIDNGERNYSFDGGTSVFRNNVSCRGSKGSNDRIIGDTDSSNQFWSGSNGSRCSSYTGALNWSFAADGRLVVTFGGNRITP
ncbi:right-handed parallel beta-helix repeat-containing protein [Streptomyces scopuliridis]|uniref:right-handed parallel beta-helix repeat-containing protein n=1 Tax=Streptomyces scopuliridis TaxID=452529 RepID=UPI0036B53488